MIPRKDDDTPDQISIGKKDQDMECQDENDDLHESQVIEMLQNIESQPDNLQVILDFYSKYKYTYGFQEMFPFLQFVIMNADRVPEYRTLFYQIFRLIITDKVADQFIQTPIASELFTAFPNFGTPFIFQFFVIHSEYIANCLIQWNVVQALNQFFDSPPTYESIIVDVLCFIEAMTDYKGTAFDNMLSLYNKLRDFTFANPHLVKYTFKALTNFMYDQNCALNFLLNPSLQEMLEKEDPAMIIPELELLLDYTFDDSDKKYNELISGTDTTCVRSKVVNLKEVLKNHHLFLFDYFYSLLEKYVDNEDIFQSVLESLSNLSNLSNFAEECESLGITKYLIDSLDGKYSFTVKKSMIKFLLVIGATSQNQQFRNLVEMNFLNYLSDYFEEIQYSLFDDLMSFLYHLNYMQEMFEDEELSDLIQQFVDEVVIDKLNEMLLEPEKLYEVGDPNAEEGPYYNIQGFLGRYDCE
ncbi:hypothetical protein TVAG_091040 [Trichomonas vaginalis G3]|uniref:Uncharacterized protein n=1 Tax=Trichomonas vaginalis (strain ATCC PRA-98 / G3) TaxID=412133 RepID=A2F608_TRIV3|nr:hypothetical protein TVAGG3_0579170 [Trichomonas vaginalis G3]EAX99637.1 hypothetical protein TVAG_091040 [Trichomonas vaginalis G3]KAI5522438.1 hypothetical protein TVAGG3_0579170 [Trichomonas vaginalis G3]|eukprot:XP_001312567.1 hypothetical protein [Trichomonas vaginalis G3]